MQSMYQFIRSRCEYPGDSALYYLGRSISYRAFFRAVDAIAGYLYHGEGLRRGDVVTIALPNIPAAVEAFYALSKLGCVANMVHPLVPPNQLAAYMKEVGSRHAFVFDMKFPLHAKRFREEGFTAYVCGAAQEMGAVKGGAYRLINRKTLHQIKYGEQVRPFREMLASTFAPVPENTLPLPFGVLMHSGGTTGSPKTVMITDEAINYQAAIGKGILGITDARGKGMLAVLPLFHIFGLAMCVHTILGNGCQSVLVPEFNVGFICAAMRRTNLNYFTGVPAMYDALTKDKRFLNRGRRNVEFAFCGGDSMPEELKRRFDELVRAAGSRGQLLEGYGLTEAMVCVVNTDSANRTGSVGLPVAGARVRICNPETGETLPGGELGEIWVNAPMNMAGYWGDPETTAKVLTEDAEGRWVHTGDFGCLDADGYVWFKQRLKRIVKVNGVAVFPTEIEEQAARFPGVARVCAVGVPHPKAGETVKLFVQMERAEDATDATAEKLKGYLAENLIKWAVPRIVEFVEDMPKTLIGKTDYRALSQR